MNIERILNPYDLPPNFRAYVYDKVVLAKETKHVRINPSTFDKGSVYRECGLDVLMVGELDELQLHDSCQWPEGEFLLFLKGKGGGYAVLFKRLRDTFAHGHYGANSEASITIRHRYRGLGEKIENTRVFGNLKVATLKKLVAFLQVDDGSPR